MTDYSRISKGSQHVHRWHARALNRTSKRLIGLVAALAIAVNGLFLAALPKPALAAAGATYLAPNESLTGGQYIVSPNSQYVLYMNTDGNLILFVWSAAPRVLWQTGTSGHSGSSLVQQADGNLVLYDSGGHAYWATNRFGASSILFLQSDGNLVVYNQSASPIWATGTLDS